MSDEHHATTPVDPNPSDSTQVLSNNAVIIRELTVLALALGMMMGLHTLRLEGGEGIANTLTLGAIGFVILAAYTFGEIVRRRGLPKVTGYIIAGIVFGPSIAGVLTAGSVQDMKTFNTLALGLIALSAGLELHLSSLRAVLRTMLVTTIAKLPLLLLLVGGSIVGMLSIWPMLEFPSQTHLIGFALVIAVLGLGTSPAIALAVSNDAKARGRLTDLIMGSAIIKDLVVVVALAITVAVVGGWFSESASGSGLAVTLAKELGGSVALGSVLGGALILYLRYAGQQMLAVTVIVILLTAELSHWLHLEVLLVFISAGFVVSNFSEFEHALLDPITRVALPVFVVFFTTAGAALDLLGTLKILPVAILIVIMRTVAFFIANQVGTRAGNEKPVIRSNAWLGYLPQAGVTLGLTLLAAEALPVLRDQLLSVGVAAVALNLLIGPVTLGMALRRAGETPQKPKGAKSKATASDVPEPSTREALEPPVLAHFDSVDSDLIAAVDAQVLKTLEPWSQDLTVVIRSLLEVGSDDDSLRRLEAAVLDMAPSANFDWYDDMHSLFSLTVARLRELPRELVLPMGPDHLERAATAGLVPGCRVAIERLRRRLGLPERPRTLPLRMVARISLEPTMATGLRDSLGVLARAHASGLELLRGRLASGRPVDESIEALEEVLSTAIHRVRTDLHRAVKKGLLAARKLAAVAGGPAAPTGSLKYSAVEPEITEAIQGLKSDTTLWADALRATLESTAATCRVARVRRSIDEVLMVRGVEPAHRLVATANPAIDCVISGLKDLQTRISATDSPLPPFSDIETALKAALPASLRRSLRRSTRTVREETQMGRVLGFLESREYGSPLVVAVVPASKRVSNLPTPTTLVFRKVDFGESMERSIQERLVPAMEATMSPFWEFTGSLTSRLQQSISVVLYAAELASRGEFGSDDERRDALHKAVRRAERVANELKDELATHETRIASELGGLASEMVGVLAGPLDRGESASSHRFRELWSSIRSAASRRMSRFTDWWRHRIRRLTVLLEFLSKRREVRDRRIRSGHERVDSRVAREYLSEHLPAPSSEISAFGQLFSPTPATDRRFFTARRELLRSIVTDLRTKSGGAVLLSGPTGAGRTSFINLAQLQLGGVRVIRPEADFGVGRGLVARMCSEMGCAPGIDALSAELTRSESVVLLDDLSHWFDPARGGDADVADLAKMIRSCRDSVRWLVTISDDAATGLVNRGALTAIFNRHVQLTPLGAQELGEMLRIRHQIAGVTFRFGLGAVLARLPWARHRAADLYLHALHRRSKGNARDALLLHVWASDLKGDRLVIWWPPPLAIPFLGQLDSPSLAVLSLLTRHGALTEQQLSQVLRDDGLAVTATSRLQHAGLIEKVPRSRRYAVPVHVLGSVVSGLRDLKVLPEDSPW